MTNVAHKMTPFKKKKRKKWARLFVYLIHINGFTQTTNIHDNTDGKCQFQHLENQATDQAIHTDIKS